jgi:hypothetical protein
MHDLVRGFTSSHVEVMMPEAATCLASSRGHHVWCHRECCRVRPPFNFCALPWLRRQDRHINAIVVDDDLSLVEPIRLALAAALHFRWLVRLSWKLPVLETPENSPRKLPRSGPGRKPGLDLDGEQDRDTAMWLWGQRKELRGEPGI